MKKLIFIIATLSALVAVSLSRAEMPESLRAARYMRLMLCDSISPALRRSYIDTLAMLDYWRNPLHLGERARAYTMSRDYEAAVRDLTGVLRENSLPENRRFNYLYWRAFCNLILGSYNDAVDDLYTLYTSSKTDSLLYYNVEAMMMMSGVYDKIGNMEMTDSCLKRAERIFASLETTPAIRKNLTYRLHLERAGYYIKKGEYEKALSEDNAARDIGLDAGSLALMYMDLAQIFEESGDRESAEEYYMKFFEVVRSNSAARFNLGYATSNYALFLFNSGRYDESVKVIRGYLGSPEDVGGHVGGALYNTLSRDYDALGHHKDAYEALMRSTEILDSVMGAAVSGAVLGATQRFEKRLAEAEIENSRNHARRMTLAVISLVAFAGVITVLTVWLWRRYVRQRRMRLKSEREKNVIESTYQNEIKETRTDLNISSREIVSLTMQMAEKDAAIDEIREMSRDNSLSQRELISSLRTRLAALKTSQKTWDVFRVYFEKSHPDFYVRLHALHPDLTQGESKMCAFIHMNMTVREIAGVTNRSERAVESMKYRLHKKLGIGSNVSTAEYLRQIMQ